MQETTTFDPSLAGPAAEPTRASSAPRAIDISECARVVFELIITLRFVLSGISPVIALKLTAQARPLKPLYCRLPGQT